MTQPVQVLTVVGARPQFVKAAMVTPALREMGIIEHLVHTGQHYDWEMSASFFEGLSLPEPTFNLKVGSGRQSLQTARMLEGLEPIMIEVDPGMVLLYGDTNSTLAGALAAAKLNIPVAHVEAGLRSFNRRMPEEVNRVLTDHVSTLLFAPTPASVDNLTAEGITAGVVRTGDVMYDLALKTEGRLEAMCDEILARFQVEPESYALATIHRVENTEDLERWMGIVGGFRSIGEGGLPVIWPAHPRTREKVEKLSHPDLRIIPPLGYLELQVLIRYARVVFTDSGGVQKEAAFRQTPCRTIRPETEWTELLDFGVNQLVEAEPAAIFEAAQNGTWPKDGVPIGFYGHGRTSEEIAVAVHQYCRGS